MNCYTYETKCDLKLLILFFMNLDDVKIQNTFIAVPIGLLLLCVSASQYRTIKTVENTFGSDL